VIGLLIAATASPLAAVAAVSPDEQWVTSVPGNYNAAATISFGATGVTAVLGPTSARCAGGGNVPNGTTNANLVSRNAQSFYSPQAPASAVAVYECLLGASTASRTVTFNTPIVGPVFHVNNLDASMLDFSAPVTLETVKKNFPLQVQNSGSRLRNAVNMGTASCTDSEIATNNPGCGSFRLSQAGGAVDEFTITNTALAGNDGWFWSLSFHVAPLTKSFSPATIVESGTSELSLVITNPATEGAVDLDGVDYVDVLPAGVTIADSAATMTDCGAAIVNGGAPEAGQTAVSVTGASIAAGEECVVTVAVTAASAGTYINDNDNLTTSLGNVVPSANATLDVVAPELDLTKSVVLSTDANSNGLADVGDEVTYSFLVENTGDVPVEDVIIDDPRVAATTPVSQSVPAGESRTFVANYSVVQADIDAGLVSNTATASGVYRGPGGDVSIVSEPDTADVPTPTRTPSLTLAKSGLLDDSNGNGTADVGEEIDFTFIVTNTGNVTLTAVEVVDDRVSGVSPASVTLVAGGGEQRFTSDPYVVTQADVDAGEVLNVASARAATPMGTTIASAQDTVRFETTPVTTPSEPAPVVNPAPSGLASTGAEALVASGIAAGFLLLGLAAVVSTRRRAPSCL
jgi:uncharacterized repeat protein (TIGR01451 family)